MANFSIRFKEKREVAHDTFALAFTKPTGFTYEAGQYVALVVQNLVKPDPKGGVRSFSLSSAPYEEDLIFAFRNTGSGFKETLMAMKPGDTVEITKPVGHFTLSHASDGNPIVFLVGGIGITPVRSILKQAEHNGATRELSVFYSNRRKADAAFDVDIREVQLSGLRYVTTYTQEEGPLTDPNEERGYINEPMLLKHLGAEHLLENWYYLVGAPAFIEAMKDMLGGLGVPKERLVVDPFAGLSSALKKELETKK